MGSREKDQSTPHQPLLSSLVVRPTDSGGGAGGAGSDYEPGEVRRNPPQHSRSERFAEQGYRMHAGSASPVRSRDAQHRFSPGFEHSVGGLRNRGFGNGRDAGRYRDYSPPYGRGRGGGRFAGRGTDRPARGPGTLGGEGLPRNNPNVHPREGDWICSNPSCKNLNFARRENCNNCNKPRYARGGSPRRFHSGPPVPRRQDFLGPPLDRSPGRIGNGYRSPPRGWPRDAPRDLRAAGPPPRHERFRDPLAYGGRQDHQEYDYRDRDGDRDRDRDRHDRPIPLDWDHRAHGRDGYFNERRGSERRPISSPPTAAPPPPRGWAHVRERSRSPVRGGAPPKDYQRGMYMNRGRGGRRLFGRDAY